MKKLEPITVAVCLFGAVSIFGSACARFGVFTPAGQEATCVIDSGVVAVLTPLIGPGLTLDILEGIFATVCATDGKPAALHAVHATRDAMDAHVAKMAAAHGDGGAR